MAHFTRAKGESAEEGVNRRWNYEQAQTCMFQTCEEGARNEWNMV